ncbi:hypothetical protein, partial [Enterococcus faecium]|uniref:hypothetical protein n=2 Tax=Enterococcus faecium TaxID=1352 RepID=UPI001C4F056D
SSSLISSLSSLISKGASLAPQDIRIDLAVFPETCCKGLFYIFSILGQKSEQPFFDCSLSSFSNFSKKL